MVKTKEEKEDLKNKNEFPKPVIPGTLESINFLPSGMGEEQDLITKLYDLYIDEKRIVLNIHKEMETGDKTKKQISINPSKYEFLQEYFSINEFKTIYRCIKNYRYECLETFERVLEIKVRKQLNLELKRIDQIISFEYELPEDQNFIEKIYLDKFKNLNSKLNGSFLIVKAFYQVPSKSLEVRIPIQFKYRCLKCGGEFPHKAEFKPNKCIDPKCKASKQKDFKKIDTLDFETELVFSIRDSESLTLKCKVKKNQDYFRDLKLSMDSVIELQGVFKIKDEEITGESEKYLDVIDIKVIVQYDNLVIPLGKDFQGIKSLQLNTEGLTKYIKSPKGDVFHFPILDVPFQLLNYYEGENETLYEIFIENKTICKTKDDFLRYISKEKNYSYCSGPQLFNYINPTFRFFIKQKNLIPKPMFSAIGIHSRDGELIICYPGIKDIKLYGENDFQREAIEEVEKIGIDEDSKLSKAFFKMIHINKHHYSIRLVLAGFTAISPFLWAISDYLTIFPNLFITGIEDSGKTSILRIFINKMYGTRLIKPDDIRTMARLTKQSTAYTFPMNFDDLNKMPPENITFIKTTSTEKGPRKRMRKDQKLLKEQIYPTYSGSANKLDFLKDDSAFRKRCFIFNLTKRVGGDLKGRLFEKIENRIKKNKIYGYYFLKKCCEFINNSTERKSINNHDKLVDLLEYNKNHLNHYLKRNNIRLTDSRRLQMYNLIHIGLQFWNYVFESNNLKSHLFDKVLNFENKMFGKIIQKLEGIERELSIEDFEHIIEFFKENKREFGKYQGIGKNKGRIVLLTKFIHEYDRFAILRGYPTITSLTNLGIMQSELLERETKVKTIKYKNIEDPTAKGENDRGLIFYLGEIEKLRGIKRNGSKPTNSEIGLIKVLEGQISEKILSRIAKMISENNNKAIYIEGVVEILDLEDDLDKKDISKTIEGSIKKGILFNPRKREDLIQFTKKGKLILS